MKEMVSSMSRRSILGSILTLFIIGASVFMSGGKSILFLPLISGSALLILFLYRSHFPYSLSLYTKGAFISLSLFITFGIVATSFSADVFLSIQGLMAWSSYFVVFLAGFVVFNDPVVRRSMLWIIIFFGLVSSMCAVFDFVFNGSGFSRLSGSFFDSNMYGGFLLFPFFFALAQLINEKRAALRVSLVIASGFLLAAIILTFSRGTWISVVIGVACLFFLTIKGLVLKSSILSLIKNIFGVALVAVAVASFVVAVQAQQGLSDKVSAVRSYETVSENGVMARLHYIDDALRVFRMHPFTGSGFGNYIFDLRSINDNPMYFSVNPHNIYIEVLATLGVGGFLSFVAFFFFFFLFGYKKYKEIQNSEPIFIGSFAVVVALLFHIGVEANSAYPSIMVLLFLFTGIVFGKSCSFLKKHESHHNVVLVAVIIVMASVTVFSSVYVYSVQSAVLDGEYYFGKGEIGEAVNRYNYAISISPFNASAYLGLAVAQEKLALREKNTQEKHRLFRGALSNVEAAVRFSSKNANALNTQGRLLVLLGDYEKAKAVLLKSETFDRINIDANSLLIDLYTKEGKTEDVLSEINVLLPIYESYVKTAAFKSDPDRLKIIRYMSGASSIENRLRPAK